MTASVWSLNSLITQMWQQRTWLNCNHFWCLVLVRSGRMCPGNFKCPARLVRVVRLEVRYTPSLREMTFIIVLPKRCSSDWCGINSCATIWQAKVTSVIWNGFHMASEIDSNCDFPFVIMGYGSISLWTRTDFLIGIQQSDDVKLTNWALDWKL